MSKLLDILASCTGFEWDAGNAEKNWEQHRVSRGECEQVCEFGAIQLQGEGDSCVAWIDAAICRGGGICAAHCPAGAIMSGHPTSVQIEAMLEAILA